MTRMSPVAIRARGYRTLATCLERPDIEALRHCLLQAALAPSPLSHLAVLLPHIDVRLPAEHARLFGADGPSSATRGADLLRRAALHQEELRASPAVQDFGAREWVRDELVPWAERLSGALANTAHPFYDRLSVLILNWIREDMQEDPLPLRSPRPAADEQVAVDAGSVCTRGVLVIEVDATVREAASVMRERHVGDLVVVAERHGRVRPIGIVTDRDIAVGVVSLPAETLDALSVGDLVVGDLVTVPERASVSQCVERMRAAAVRRLPVVDADGALVGILTLDDLVRVLARDMGALADLVSAQPRREAELRVAPGIGM